MYGRDVMTLRFKELVEEGKCKWSNIIKLYYFVM